MMLEGIAWAVLAGIMLGLYALPEKYTKGFHYPNTWGLFFFVAMFIVPFAASFLLLDGLAIYGQVESRMLFKMVVAGLLWGVGMMLWGKAINHIGLTLGFSLFIGTVILIGSLIPWMINSSGHLSLNTPEPSVLYTVLIGLSIVLAGVVFIGRAGLTREADEKQGSEEDVNQGTGSKQTTDEHKQKGSMLKGIFIAVVGGVLATAFSYANAVGIGPFNAAAISMGLDEWKAAVAVMNVIYVSGGIVAVSYFIFSLTKENKWSAFLTPRIGVNLSFILIMALLNFSASVTFSYAASELGPAAGKTVGYAIFNAMSILTATLAGLLAGEWSGASRKSKRHLFAGLASMLTGIVIIAVANGMSG